MRAARLPCHRPVEAAGAPPRPLLHCTWHGLPGGPGRALCLAIRGAHLHVLPSFPPEAEHASCSSPCCPPAAVQPTDTSRRFLAQRRRLQGALEDAEATSEGGGASDFFRANFTTFRSMGATKAGGARQPTLCCSAECRLRQTLQHANWHEGLMAYNSLRRPPMASTAAVDIRADWPQPSLAVRIPHCRCSSR